MQTILADIESLVSQLKQVSSNTDSPADGSVQMAEDAGTHMEPDADDATSKLDQIKKLLKDMEGGEPDEDDKKKDKVEKSDEGSSLDDGAEAVIDEQPENSKQNVNEVAKALAKLLGVKTVANRQPKQSSEMNQVIKALNRIVERVGEQEKAIIGIYEGLGVADEIKKSANVQVVEKSRPMNDPIEQERQIEYIRKALGIETPVQSKSAEGRFDLKKALCDNDGLALSAMLSTKQK